MTTIESLSDTYIAGPSSGAWTGPVPVPDRDSAFYWSGLQEQRLLVSACNRCSYLIYPPVAGCPRCSGIDLGQRELAGTGTIYSFTVVNREFAPGIKPPFIVAIVQLDEQPDLRMMTNLVEVRIGDVRIGQRVHVVFQQVMPDVTLAFFTPEAS
ncbi:Zn-ribbon domain-containing OB-fold protein [Williamsia sp. D3]|uniref:Zn-ribbon domain-containing OB-fold protein n=1 Tax=Williamsia sp. D3 TaxID=1313067 RepID=UPI0003D355E0|nr:Zn-ribbon domain-containing OB-fold protein [Williamsia sp. D3]ETD33317.1 DNA-binding protein [Williamsia sp. D3]